MIRLIVQAFKVYKHVTTTIQKYPHRAAYANQHYVWTRHENFQIVTGLYQELWALFFDMVSVSCCLNWFPVGSGYLFWLCFVAFYQIYNLKHIAAALITISVVSPWPYHFFVVHSLLMILPLLYGNRLFSSTGQCKPQSKPSA